MELQREARRRKISLAAVLDLAARDWLKRGGAETDDHEQQLRLRKAARKCLGILASGDARRAQNVRRAVRRRLAEPAWPLRLSPTAGPLEPG